MSGFIFHITPGAAWSAARGGGHYAADSLAGEGFIHCSTAGQLLRVADLFFTGQHGLVLLVIDPVLLNPELRWEPGSDLVTELYPHVYGPVNLGAVVDALEFEPGPDGKFHLPKSPLFADR